MFTKASRANTGKRRFVAWAELFDSSAAAQPATALFTDSWELAPRCRQTVEDFPEYVQHPDLPLFCHGDTQEGIPVLSWRAGPGIVGVARLQASATVCGTGCRGGLPARRRCLNLGPATAQLKTAAGSWNHFKRGAVQVTGKSCLVEPPAVGRSSRDRWTSLDVVSGLPRPATPRSDGGAVSRPDTDGRIAGARHPACRDGRRARASGGGSDSP